MNGQDEFDDILKNKIGSQEFPFDEANWEKASAMIDASRNALRNKLDAEEFPFDEANWKKASAMIDASHTALRDKLDAEEFPFDEANWKKASAMIDAARGERKPVAIYLAAAALVLILSVSGYLLFDSDVKPATSSMLTGNTTTDHAVSTSETTDSRSTEPPAVNAQAPVSPDHSETAAAKEHSGGPVPAEFASEVKNTAATTAKDMHQPAITDQHSAGSANVELHKKISNGSSAQTPVKNAAANEANQSGTSGNPAISNGTTSKTEHLKEELNKDAPRAGDIVPPASTDAASASSPEAKDNTPAESIAAVDSAAKAITVAAASLKANTAAQVVQESKFRTEKEPRNFIYFEGGTNYLLGWKNLDEKDASGFNPVFGLHFFHMFKKNIGFTVGTQYNCVGNLNYSSHTSTYTHYDFGKVDDVTVITPTKIHYVSGVVKLNYVFKKNNIFGIGCNVSYLLNVDNKVETYNERDNQISQLQISKTNGYVDGFNTIDVQATLSYRRMLYKDFGANVELFYGLTDVKTNGFFNTNYFERNSGMKVTLTYNIFKK